MGWWLWANCRGMRNLNGKHKALISQEEARHTLQTFLSLRSEHAFMFLTRSWATKVSRRRQARGPWSRLISLWLPASLWVFSESRLSIPLCLCYTTGCLGMELLIKPGVLVGLFNQKAIGDAWLSLYEMLSLSGQDWEHGLLHSVSIKEDKCIYSATFSLMLSFGGGLFLLM